MQLLLLQIGVVALKIITIVLLYRTQYFLSLWTHFILKHKLHRATPGLNRQHCFALLQPYVACLLKTFQEQPMYLSIHKKLSWKALLLVVKLAFFPLHNRHSETVKEIFAVVIIFSLAPNTESTSIPCYKANLLESFIFARRF